eukprot:2127-Heterococcus_DN1.PRE.1
MQQIADNRVHKLEMVFVTVVACDQALTSLADGQAIKLNLRASASNPPAHPKASTFCSRYTDVFGHRAAAGLIA